MLAVLLILAIVGMYLFTQKKTKDDLAKQTPASSPADWAPQLTKTAPGEQTIAESLTPEPSSSDQINYISPTKVTARTPVKPDENGVKRYTVAVTPAPEAGYFDWTKNLPTGEYEVVDLSQSKFADIQPCEIIGLENKWSNVIEKMSCDGINFMAGRITEALNELNCAFSSSAIQANFNPSVTYKVEGGMCMILDRIK